MVNVNTNFNVYCFALTLTDHNYFTLLEITYHISSLVIQRNGGCILAVAGLFCDNYSLIDLA